MNGRADFAALHLDGAGAGLAAGGVDLERETGHREAAGYPQEKKSCGP
jgi:hypothetical protein